MPGQYTHKEPYRDINQVMRAIRHQVINSVEYCYSNLPRLNSPYQLWQALKPRVTFVHDPEKVELLQTAKTLFENNYHGQPGAGDCDCFAILVVACCVVQGWPVDIVLAGNSRTAPSHIYCYVHDGNQRFTFDLTQPRFNQERQYKIYQTLPIRY